MATYPKITRDITEPATIADLKVDVVLSKETTFDSEVTQYPVEDGFPVADHVTRNPMQLTMEVVCTPTPVTFFADLGANQAADGRKVLAGHCQSTGGFAEADAPDDDKAYATGGDRGV